jgi:hypothetical protein
MNDTISDTLQIKRKEKELQAMPHIGKSICDFCLEKDIENIIFLDRSARPAYQTFKEQWRENYQDKQRPNIYFITPKLMENLGVDEEEIQLFKKEQPHLYKNKKPTLIFDVCLKSGLTLYNVTDLLKKSNFDEVYTIVTSTHRNEKQYFTPDKIIYKDEDIGCHIFGRFFNKEIGVHKKENYSFLSQVNKNETYNTKLNRTEMRRASRKQNF